MKLFITLALAVLIIMGNVFTPTLAESSTVYNVLALQKNSGTWNLSGNNLVQGQTSANSQSEDLTEIQEATSSVFYVEILDESGKQIGTTTGFVAFEEHLFITSLHTINNASYLRVRGDEDERTVLFKVVAYDKVHDIAMLLFPFGSNYNSLVFNTSGELKVGQSIVSIGNPNDYHDTFSYGQISGFLDMGTNDGNKWIQFTSPSSQVSNGGCLFDDNGKVIGMISSIGAISTDSETNGEDIQTAVPIQAVQELYMQWDKKSYENLGDIATSLSTTSESSGRYSLDAIQEYCDIWNDYYAQYGIKMHGWYSLTDDGTNVETINIAYNRNLESVNYASGIIPPNSSVMVSYQTENHDYIFMVLSENLKPNLTDATIFSYRVINDITVGSRQEDPYDSWGMMFKGNDVLDLFTTSSFTLKLSVDGDVLSVDIEGEDYDYLYDMINWLFSAELFSAPNQRYKSIELLPTIPSSISLPQLESATMIPTQDLTLTYGFVEGLMLNKHL